MSGLGVGEGGGRAARGGREATDEGEGTDDHHLPLITTPLPARQNNCCPPLYMYIYMDIYHDTILGLFVKGGWGRL